MLLKKILLFKSKFFAMLKKEPVIFICLSVTAVTAIFFRTFAYFDRIYVYADGSLFVQAAYYAYKNHLLPQIGPFAQGPFFTGPWWLWFLKLTFIFPFGLLTPWYFMAILSLLFIILIYFTGVEMGGKRLGIIAVLLTAVSTAQIDNSFMTWNATADPILGLLAIFSMLCFRRKKNPLYLFLLGFSVSLATAIHFQSAYLLPLIFITVISTRPKLKNFVFLITGGLIPLLPFLYFDIRFHWFEARRIIDYMMIGQYRIYVPNRWLTYGLDFWPESWAWVIGGTKWVAYGIMGLIVIMSLLRLPKFKLHWNYYLIAISFGLSIIMLRYFRGERFFYYTNYAHAYVLLLTAWMTNELFRLKKIFGIIAVSLIFIFSFQATLKNIAPRAITYGQVNKLAEDIYKTYPGQSIDIYECPFVASMLSTPLSYRMYYDGRNSLDGIKIGVCNDKLKLTWREITDKEIDQKYGYKNKSTPFIYTDMTEWWVKNPPGEALY